MKREDERQEGEETLSTRALRALVLSVDIGAGHRMAAQALCDALDAARPGSTRRVLDALDYLGPRAGKFVKKLYFDVLDEAPDLWGAVYEERGLVDLFRPVTEFLEEARTGRLMPEIRSFAPDVVLAMHPVACGLAGALGRENRARCPLVAVVTDFDAHPAWIARGLDLYLCPTEAVAGGLRRHGLPTGRAVATGLPLRPGFAEVRSITDAPARLGLAPDRLTILVLGGGLGLGPLAETARLLGDLDGPVQVVVIAGRNADLAARARTVAESSRVPIHVREQVDDMWTYMAAARLAVGKAGGLTCAELMAAGVPLVALASIPGQERANVDALTRAGAAVDVPDAEAAADHVRRLLADPSRLSAMAEAARRLGRPGAARAAAGEVLRVVDEWPTLKYMHRAPAGEDPFAAVDEALAEFADVERNLDAAAEDLEDEKRRQAEEERELDEDLRRLKKEMGVE